MGQRDDRLQSLGFWLDYYAPYNSNPWTETLVVDGSTVYVSPQAPYHGEQLAFVGNVPLEVSVEDATRAAALAAANALRAVRRQFGSLDRVERVIRLAGYVYAEPGFAEAGRVMDGASQLMYDVFGDAGRHVRTAIPVQHLPLGATVEVEMVLKVAAG